jgi:predicted DNA binding protein
MPRVRLTLTLPGDTPLGSITRAHPAARLRVRSALTAGTERAAWLVEADAPDLVAVVAALSDDPGVERLDVLAREAGVATCLLAAAPGPLRAAAAAGTPPTFPFTIADGTATVAVLGPDAALSDLATRLADDGYGVTVASAAPATDPVDPLTARQRRLVRAAVDRGYYHTPRECTLGELAATVDLAKSTCSETLRRAERTLLESYLGRGDSA